MKLKHPRKQNLKKRGTGHQKSQTQPSKATNSHPPLNTTNEKSSEKRNGAQEISSSRPEVTTKKARPNGPKVSLYRLSSKEDYKEEMPSDSENEIRSLKKRKKRRKREEKTQVDIEEKVKRLKMELNRGKFSITMGNFYNTNTSQIAREEDDFWRYDREQSIVDRKFGEVENSLDRFERTGDRTGSILRGSRQSVSFKRSRISRKNVSFAELVNVQENCRRRGKRHSVMALKI